MDRKSWLWRRKNSEKSPNGETESSGSLSSHSERFSDEQTLSNPSTQSPEVTSKAANSDELNDSVKSLSEKLSEALADVHAKEELVKQHSKVAEEAVSGWERSENEVLVLKKQVEGLTQKNSTLEERVGHLDGALKECLRQLRQSREEQKEKIYEAIVKKTYEWESKNSQFENQLIELQSQLQNAKTNTTDINSKVEVLEKENLILNLMLTSRTEELELSTRSAESASKQHLDSLRKVVKLEAECRRLKAVAQKAALANDQLSVTASSIYAESVTDTQSESGEKMLFIENDFRKKRTTCERNSVVPSVEIDLMDDFLEMERLAACPDSHSGRNDSTWAHHGQYVEAMMNRTAELEEKVMVMEKEKVDLETALNECQILLKMSEDRLEQTRVKLVELSTALVQANEMERMAEKVAEFTKVDTKNLTKLLDEAKLHVVQVQDKLISADEAKSMVELELKNVNIKKAEAESKLKEMELQIQITHSSIHILEEEVDKERKFSREALAKCEKLDDEMSRMKLDSRVQRSAIVDEFRTNQDKEMAVAASKFAECQKTIASLGRQLQSLATFEDLLIESEGPETVL